MRQTISRTLLLIAALATLAGCTSQFGPSGQFAGFTCAPGTTADWMLSAGGGFGGAVSFAAHGTCNVPATAPAPAGVQLIPKGA